MTTTTDFDSLVLFYDTPSDLAALFGRLRDGELSPPPRTPELAAFLHHASWASRWTEIEQAVR